MVRAPRCVWIISTSENFVGESSCAMVSVPSPQEAKAYPVTGSKRFASTPWPMGTVPRTLPELPSEGHELVVATDDEYLVCGANGEAGGRLAGRERPGIFDLESLGVEFDERALVLEIDEDFAFAIGGTELRPPT